MCGYSTLRTVVLLWREIEGASSFLFTQIHHNMPKKNELGKDVNNSTILTPSNCTTSVIRNYFQYILTLSKSGEAYPVNLEDVYYLAYSRKDHAIDALKKDEVFMQDVDYQVFPQIRENLFGGRPKDIYKLSIPCLEYFIARKVRPVFEVYRQVFHAAPDVAMKVRADKTKMEKLEKENEFLKHQIEVVKGIYKQEINLKCSCFSFLVKKKLYGEWESFRKESEHLNFIRSLNK